MDGAERRSLAVRALDARARRGRRARAPQLDGAGGRREPGASKGALLRRARPDQPGGSRVERGVSRYDLNIVLYRLKKDEAFRSRFEVDPRGTLVDADLTDE